VEVLQKNNPNTNDFYVAINGGDYSSACAGDLDTASPSNKDVQLKRC
jgi:hypothetical protein